MAKAAKENPARLESILEATKGQGKAYEERAFLRDLLSDLTPGGEVIRLSPEGEETDRKLKRMVTEAAKDINRREEVKYVEDGRDLLIFVRPPQQKGTSRVGRPRKNP